MAWIELHTALRNHPKCDLVAIDLDKDKTWVIGAVACLWTWTLEFAEDGDLSKFPKEMIEVACGWKGEPGRFYESLLGRGFLDEDEKVHDWLDYVGRYLRGKYHDSNKPLLRKIWTKYGYVYGRGAGKGGKIKRKSRKSKGSDKEAEGNPQRTSPYPTIPYRTLPTHGESMYDSSWESFWKKYPARNGRKLGKEEARKLFYQLPAEDLSKILLAVKNFAFSQQVKDGVGIMDPKRFINRGNGAEPWRDWVEPEKYVNENNSLDALKRKRQALKAAIKRGKDDQGDLIPAKRLEELRVELIEVTRQLNEQN